MAMILVLMFGKLLQLAFFGHLRALELEHLYERTWYAIMETFLAMTIFHDEFTFQFALMFSILTFLRVFHWIAQDRVDLIFQTVNPPNLLNKSRLWISLFILLVSDVSMFLYCGSEVLEHGPGTMVMFSFEFAILCNSIVNSVGKYILNLIESNYLINNEDEDVWESKGTFTFVLEVISDTIRLTAYITLFMFLLDPYGIPLHIFRDVYTTAVSLFGRYRDFIRFRRARARMDEQIANAVEEDLLRDSVCIICREEMVVSANQTLRYIPKKLSCGHVIHHGCLKSWLERSQRCPTCRRPVMDGEGVQEGGAQGGAGVQGGVGGGAGVQGGAGGAGEAGRPVGEVLGQLRPEEANNGPTNGNMNNGGVNSTNTTEVPAQLSQDDLIVDSRLILPSGWSAFRARNINGIKQVKLNQNTWGTISGTTASIPENSTFATPTQSASQPNSSSSAGRGRLEILETMLEDMEKTQKEFEVSILRLRQAAEALRNEQQPAQEE